MSQRKLCALLGMPSSDISKWQKKLAAKKGLSNDNLTVHPDFQNQGCTQRGLPKNVPVICKSQKIKMQT